MPVHRFGWDAENKIWFEWGVSLEGENFVWAQLPDSESSSAIFQRLARQSGTEAVSSSLLDVLPDGYTIETCPAAESWWREAAGQFGVRKTDDD